MGDVEGPLRSGDGIPEDGADQASEVVDAGSDADGLTPERAIELVEMARGSGDFTLDYDHAIDVLEEDCVERALASLRELKPDEAIEHLNVAEGLRDEHLKLLESASSDPEHLLKEKIDGLRDYAEDQRALLAWLMHITGALQTFRSGEWNLALQTLDQQGAAIEFEDPEVLSVMSSIVGAAGELLAGEIRFAVQDYSGARAAFDRSASLHQHALGKIRQHAPDADLVDHPIRFAEAASLRAQCAQLLQANDFANAGNTASGAAAAYDAAADRLAIEDPQSQSYLVPLIRAISKEFLARAEECKAEVALEDGEWTGASDHATQASDHYDEASKECLESALPVARVSQERILNSSFNWGVQFRRRLERERQAQERLDEAQRELQELYGSVREALTPAGVTVNTQSELINSVHQQVETVTRIESQARNILREVPGALGELDLSEQERRELEEQALELANSPESGADFLEKVGRFTSQLQTIVTKAGETAAPILGILKALAILG